MTREMLPMEQRSYALRDGMLSALHFGDVTSPARLVFLHANGFNAQSYRAVLSDLGVHAIAFDMRGHGQSRDMPQPLNLVNWHIFRDDCVEFFNRHLPVLTEGPVVLAGHSFGAATAILAASQLKGRVSGCVGFDPVSLPIFARLSSILPGGRSYMKRRLSVVRNTGRRKSVFTSPQAAFERWQGKGAFRGMSDDVLNDYVAAALVLRADGQWELACDPRWEQAIFVAQWHNLVRAARNLPDNSKILYAGGQPSVSMAGSRRAVQRAQPAVDVQFDKSLRHLFPLTQTEFARQALLEVLNKS